MVICKMPAKRLRPRPRVRARPLGSVPLITVGGFSAAIIALVVVAGVLNPAAIAPAVNGDPVLSSPDDAEIAFGVGGYVNWTPTDDDTDSPTYEILSNDTPYDSGVWEDGIDICLEIPTDLAIGEYNFSCIVDDGYGLTAQDDVVITIVDDIPILNAPEDVEQDHNDNETISWTVSDGAVDSGSYSISVNGTENATGSWEDGDYINITVGPEFTPGEWEFELEVDDGLGETATDTVIVTVINVEPILDAPADFSFDDGTDGWINWTATDLSVLAGTYTSTVNGTANATGTWESGVLIQFEVTDFGIGEWVVVIEVADGYGGTDTDTVVVTIESVE